MNGILTILAFVSALIFPWPFTVLLSIAAAFLEPLVPLAVGIFADAIYLAPHLGGFPLYTLWGAGVSLAAFFVRRRLSASIIR